MEGIFIIYLIVTDIKNYDDTSQCEANTTKISRAGNAPSSIEHYSKDALYFIVVVRYNQSINAMDGEVWVLIGEESAAIKEHGSVQG